MELRRKLQILIFLTLIFGFANFCRAGFGISPPYVFNDKLLPGSRHEQRISLVRSDAANQAKVVLQVSAPGFENWINLEPGAEFIFPQGEKQIYLTVKIDVPNDAEKKEYKGALTVSLIEERQSVEGGAAVALGALIDLNLKVGGDIIREFNIYSLKIPEINEGKDLILMLGIENKGNIRSAPDRAIIDVYDISGNNLIESLQKSGIGEIESFERREVPVAFHNMLQKGAYWGIAKIFKGDEIIRQEKIFFNILDPLPAEEAKQERRAPQEILHGILGNKMSLKILFALLSITLVISAFLLFPRTKKKTDKKNK